jgi:hypothetical protein
MMVAPAPGGLSEIQHSRGLRSLGDPSFSGIMTM